MNFYDSPFYEELCKVSKDCVKNILAGPNDAALQQIGDCLPLVIASGLAAIMCIAQELGKNHPERSLEQVSLDMGLPSSLVDHITREMATHKATLHA